MHMEVKRKQKVTQQIDIKFRNRIQALSTGMQDYLSSSQQRGPRIFITCVATVDAIRTILMLSDTLK